MATQLTAPRMGEGVEELTLVKWLKQEGEAVDELDPIVEVETDKVVTELPSPASGVVLKRLVNEGETVKVGDLLAWIGSVGEAIPTDPKMPSVNEEKLIPVPKKEVRGEKKTQTPDTFLSPLVKRMLQENNLDAREIAGSGKDGRITKHDVQAHLQSSGSDQITPEEKLEKGSIEKSDTPSAGLHPISSIRRTIASRMMESLRTSAHVLTVMEADLSRVESHRAYNKPLFAQDGVRLTLTAYFVSAIVAGLSANPKVNASWSAEGLVIHPDINLGIAVSLGEEGLIVPVIKQAETLSLLGIARQVNDLAERARSKRLQPEEVRGGTFSLTNHGMSGSLFASPIITQPQAGILGTGLVQKRAVVLTDAEGNDSIAIRPMVYLSLVFDHRVLDGEGADNFLRKVKDTLEEWQ